MKIDLHNKKQVMLGLAVISVVLFGFGMYAAFLSRHDSICANGKPPVAQRSDVIGPTEYLCSNGQTVTK